MRTLYSMLRERRPIRKDDTIITPPTASYQPSKFSDCVSHTASLTLSPGAETTLDTEDEPRTHSETGFLGPPLEIRIMIYNYVLSTKGNTYEIKDFPILPHLTWSHRDNIHTVSDIESHHLALTAVNKQIREEIEANLPKNGFRFIGIEALLSFLFNKTAAYPKDVNLELLLKASKVQVTLGSEPSPHRIYIHWKPLEYMVWHMTQPFAVEFIPTEGGEGYMKAVCEEVAWKWKSYMEYLEYNLAQ